MSRFKWAPEVYKMLSGIFCVYKPKGYATDQVLDILTNRFAKDLNKLPCYQHEIPLEHMKPIFPDKSTTDVSVVDNSAITDYSEHRLVLGDRYEPEDFEVNAVDGLSSNCSGVLVCGVGDIGMDTLPQISDSKFLRVYHAKARMGWASQDYTAKGTIIERCRYQHVTRVKLEKVCAYLLTSHSKNSYLYSGVDPDSQEAYDMAAQGLIRPTERDTPPIIYGLKCIDFQPPDFTLEIHTVNEYEVFIEGFIHDLAIKLRTLAVTTGIRRLRYGYFDTDRALAHPQWDTENIINNIHKNLDLLHPDKLFVGVHAERAELDSNSDLDMLENDLTNDSLIDKV